MILYSPARCSTIAISLFEGNVYEDGRLVRLSWHESEFLMLAAAHQAGLRTPPLPSGGRTRVVVHRIRKRFKGPVLVNVGNGRYALAPDVAIDVVQLRHGVRCGVFSLRLALHRLAANPLRPAPWFGCLESQILDVVRPFLESEAETDR